MIAATVLLAAAVVVAAGPAVIRRRLAAAAPAPAATAGPQPGDPFAAASALDVLAVCLSAGMSVPAAAAATAPWAPPPTGELLRRAADLLTLGADPERAWSLPDVHGGRPDDDTCAALLRLARRSADSGSALARGSAELAEKSRHDVVHAATAAAERAGVLIAGPLGLCFLPAFVCLGIVPVVAGLIGDVFGNGLL